jgi:hypothetical protein
LIAAPGVEPVFAPASHEIRGVALAGKSLGPPALAPQTASTFQVEL